MEFNSKKAVQKFKEGRNKLLTFNRQTKLLKTK